TIIKYSINKSSFVSISVYNLLGERVSTLINEYKTTGSYIVTFDGQNLSSGIYFCRILSNNKNKIIKMELLK
ncbi:MAG TPA: T9SS type A sorting domain-containing protein, partial [Ignavibacteriaceae bacterium]|nr:T9SS type A sorting domain-containing protein [Ignavibacteriaceae bacterium]